MVDLATTRIAPKTQLRLDWLAEQGIVISIAYGPAAGYGIIWTVQCINREGQDFTRPQQADSFDHAIHIAIMHCVHLGFIEGKVPAEVVDP